MNPKFILAAMSFSLALAVLQPVLAGPRIHAANTADRTNQQQVIQQPTGSALIRGDVHVFLRSF